jgi:hypothetical protein
MLTVHLSTPTLSIAQPDTGTAGIRSNSSTEKQSRRTPVTVKLILDFDGVLQAEYAADEWPDTVTALVPFVGDDGLPDPGWLIHWSPNVIEELDALRSLYDLSLFYLTTWLRPGNAHESFLYTVGGLTGGTRLQMPRVTVDRYGRSRWKIDEVHRVNSEIAGPLIWVDDWEVPLFGQEVTEAEVGFPSLTIGPDTGIGLTRAHLDQIRAFCESLE